MLATSSLLGVRAGLEDDSRRRVHWGEQRNGNVEYETERETLYWRFGLGPGPAIAPHERGREPGQLQAACTAHIDTMQLSFIFRARERREVQVPAAP